MPRKKAGPKSSRGRPSKYQPDFARQAYHLCLLGATNEDLAQAFGVGVTTLKRWISIHPGFRTALTHGRAGADAAVAQRLYNRALGYSHRAVKIAASPDGGVNVVPYVKHYPPDTTAAIFWLKNRRPDLWRDKHTMEHEGSLIGLLAALPPAEAERLSKLPDADLRAALERIAG